MAVLDKLMVIISANAKEFNSVMDGVEAKTEKTQSVMGKISGAGKQAGVALAGGFAVAAASAAAFAVGVRKLGPVLESYGDAVDKGVTNSFAGMNAAMDEAAKTMAITLGNGMAKASGGFVMLVEKISATVKDTGLLDKLFTGLGYVFAVLSVSIGKVVSLLGATITSFKIVAKASEMAWNSMNDWIYGTDNATEANALLNAEIGALSESMNQDLASVWDMGAWIKGIEDAQVATAKLAATPPPAPPPPPSWLETHSKNLDAMTSATRKAVEGMRKIVEDDRLIGYEADLQSAQLDQELLDMQLQRKVSLINKTKELEVEKTGIINANLQEQESAKARFDANWESSEDFKLAYFENVMGNMASLMQSGNKKVFEIGKVFAISEALINTYRGVMACIALGFPLGWVAAAATAVAGAMNVMKIKNTQFGSGSSGTPAKPSTSGTSGASAAPAAAASGPQQTNINVTLLGDSFGQGAIRGLIGQINGATSDNMRLNVAGRS